jgi:F0F1-type ATP synthase membrane subunit b/b'
MPEANKIKQDEVMVDIDTSGPETEVNLPEENVNEVTTETTNEEIIKEPVKTEDVPAEPSEQKDVQAGEQKEDEQLEDYSKGVQSRIAKLTRKMREAERREQAATEYAKAVEAKRKVTESKYEQINNDYVKQFDTRVTTGMDSAQNELARAIEAGDAAAQVEANKKIATLSIDAARLNVLKDTNTKETVVQQPAANLSQDANYERQTPQALPTPDPQAEAWASKNSWFGQDRAMTFTAFEIHKELVDGEGYDPKSTEYYAEIDKRIKVDFPHKFGNTETNTSKPVQSVASANRSVKPGRKTVRLTSSQVAIAKKLGVPLEEYAKQIKLTEGA